MEQKRVSYPISQLHPQVIRQVEPVTVVSSSVVRMNRLIGEQEAEGERKRSRSGSIIRY